MLAPMRPTPTKPIFANIRTKMEEAAENASRKEHKSKTVKGVAHFWFVFVVSWASVAGAPGGVTGVLGGPASIFFFI